jgi:hypothetical protein
VIAGLLVPARTLAITRERAAATSELG